MPFAIAESTERRVYIESWTNVLQFGDLVLYIAYLVCTLLYEVLRTAIHLTELSIGEFENCQN